MPTTQEQEVIDQVTAKLRGEFYIGQPVRIREDMTAYAGCEGVVRELRDSRIGVDLGEVSDGEILHFFKECVLPL